MFEKGEVIAGNYTIMERINIGKKTEVYKAYSESRKEDICIKSCKVFLPYREVLVKEYDIMRNLSHKGIPQVYGLFEAGGMECMCMEYISGENFSKLLKKNSINLNKALHIIISVCEIIDYLHNNINKVLYLDLKPDNIIVNENSVHLVDFGTSIQSDTVYVKDITVSYGTRKYAAPEQSDINGVLGVRTDVYGVGMLLSEVISSLKDNCSQKETKSIQRIIKNCIYNRYCKRYSDVTEVICEIINLHITGGL